MVAGTSQERLRVVIVVRCDVGRMVVAAAAAQQQQASSLRQLISMSLTVNPKNWAILVAAMAASTVTVARPVRSRGNHLCIIVAFYFIDRCHYFAVC